MSNEIQLNQPGAIVGSELNQSSAMAQATAMIQARYVMAKRFPRSWDEARIALLKECDRPEFSSLGNQGSGFYSRPVGGNKSAEGLSVRFAEAVLRIAGNMSV